MFIYGIVCFKLGISQIAITISTEVAEGVKFGHLEHKSLEWMTGCHNMEFVEPEMSGR